MKVETLVKNTRGNVFYRDTNQPSRTPTASVNLGIESQKLDTKLSITSRIAIGQSTHIMCWISSNCASINIKHAIEMFGTCGPNVIMFVTVS